MFLIFRPAFDLELLLYRRSGPIASIGSTYESGMTSKSKKSQVTNYTGKARKGHGHPAFSHGLQA